MSSFQAFNIARHICRKKRIPKYLLHKAKYLDISEKNILKFCILKWQNRSDVPLYSGLYNINICPMKNSEYKRFFIQFERKKSGNYPYSHLLPWQKESSGNFLLFIVCNFFPFYLFVILSGMINSWKGNLKSFSSPFTFVGPFLKSVVITVLLYFFQDITTSD